MLHGRQNSLLQVLVDEYIRTARPVGSSHLAEVLAVGVSPATVRNDLRSLEESGYVYQPHTSAGRVPTDRGYRYYVDHVVSGGLSRRQHQQMTTQYGQLLLQYGLSSRTAARLLATFAHSLAIAGWLDKQDVFQAGLADLLDELEQDERDSLREISALLDDIDRFLPEMSETSQGQAVIFIGNENPFFAAEHTSLVIRATTLPDQSRAVLVIAGPKRMPYQTHRQLLNEVASLFSQP